MIAVLRLNIFLALIVSAILVSLLASGESTEKVTFLPAQGGSLFYTFSERVIA